MPDTTATCGAQHPGDHLQCELAAGHDGWHEHRSTTPHDLMWPEPAPRAKAPTPAGLLDDALCHQAPSLVTRLVDRLAAEDVVALVHAIERAERVRLNRATGVNLEVILQDARDRIEGLMQVTAERFPDAASERFGVPTRG